MNGSNGIRRLPFDPNSNERAIRFVRSNFHKGFYGSITFKIEDGHVTHVREERTFLGTEIPQPDTQESPVMPIG